MVDVDELKIKGKNNHNNVTEDLRIDYITVKLFRKLLLPRHYITLIHYIMFIFYNMNIKLFFC